jgi:hypothetical protein
MSRRPAAARTAFLLALVLAGVAARAADAPDARRTGGLVRAQFGYPAQASLAFGVLVTKMPENFDCKTTCLFRGATVQGSAGTGAGEIAVGYGSLVGETGRGSWLLRRVYIGYGIRAALVRTWGMSNLYPHGVTFWGLEGAFTVSQLSLTLGVFRPTSPLDDGHSWRIFGGAGWGF